MMSMMYFVLICYTGPVKINKYTWSVLRKCHLIDLKRYRHQHKYQNTSDTFYFFKIKFISFLVLDLTNMLLFCKMLPEAL